jgi:uncharacterized protein YndB with AHSA1/START domain
MSAEAGDGARVSVMVDVPLDVAFEVFTQEVDLWWRKGPRFRAMGRTPGVLHFEGKVGGRLFESSGQGSEATTVVMGTVTAWEPPRRLAFEWRNSTFAPHERTFVEVRFEGVRGKTEVTIEHTGWKALRPDHPARHGQVGSAFVASLGRFWGDLMTSMREHVVTRGDASDPKA